MTTSDTIISMPPATPETERRGGDSCPALGSASRSKYKTIVADPPWHVGRGPEWSSNGKSRPLTYPTMTLDEIAALPVKELADDAAHLYLWTINKYIEQTYAIARAWGFAPSTLLTWCKPRHGIGLGGTYSLTTEHCLFARRGTCAAERRIDSTWWEWSRGAHSAKPEAFQDMVESVSPAPRLELFARRTRLGWHTWGNQSLCHVELVTPNAEVSDRRPAASDSRETHNGGSLH